MGNATDRDTIETVTDRRNPGCRPCNTGIVTEMTSR